MSTLSEFLALPEEHQHELAVVINKTCRRASDLAPEDKLLAQLSFIVTSPSCYFGDPKDVKTVEDCFNKRNVDDGIVFYKQMRSTQPDTTTSFHYWLGYFGGNPTAYLLKEGRSGSGGGGQWDVILENCDTDFIWRGPGNAPKHFIKAVKKAAYGDKYCEEDEE